MPFARLIFVRQDHNIGVGEILRIVVTPLSRATGRAGRGHSQSNQRIDRLLAFSDEDRPLQGDCLDNFREAIQDAARLPEGPNPAAVAVRTTLAKALWGVTHDLEQQLSSLVGVVVCRDNCLPFGSTLGVRVPGRKTELLALIDIITARLDAKSDSYLVNLPSLRLNDVRINDNLVREHERMLTGGFYAEIELGYDASIAQEKGGRPFEVISLREIQLSTRGILEKIAEGRSKLTTQEWRHLLLRSVGLEPSRLSPRAQDIMLLRMVPFVERNYNMVELGPRGTGKSHLFQQVSPYAHLISGGKATVARMFVNMANGQRGLVCQYDVVCFDEVSGVSFDQKDGVNIMKGYMESGEFSRGRESIRAEGSIVLLGNFDVDVQHQQRVGHLFGPLPTEMRNDTAFMDRIHAYLPGWDIPKINKNLFTDQFGLVSDVLAECFSRFGRRAE